LKGKKKVNCHQAELLRGYVLYEFANSTEGESAKLNLKSPLILNVVDTKRVKNYSKFIVVFCHGNAKWKGKLVTQENLSPSYADRKLLQLEALTM
jgi:hypothetical protein